MKYIYDVEFTMNDYWADSEPIATFSSLRKAIHFINMLNVRERAKDNYRTCIRVWRKEINKESGQAKETLVIEREWQWENDDCYIVVDRYGEPVCCSECGWPGDMCNFLLQFYDKPENSDLWKYRCPSCNSDKKPDVDESRAIR